MRRDMGRKGTVFQDFAVNLDLLIQFQAIRYFHLDNPVQNSLVGVVRFETVPFRFIGVGQDDSVLTRDSDGDGMTDAAELYAGVDPKLIARRIIAHASEDVGLANPIAMLQAEAAARAVEFVGMPEARLPLAQAIIAICESPKSNSVCAAVDAAMADAEKGGYGAVPVHLRDTHYAGHDRIGSGDGYKYPHDYPGHYVRQNYMPVELQGKKYYFPSDMGHEATIRKNQEIREGCK